MDFQLDTQLLSQYAITYGLKLLTALIIFIIGKFIVQLVVGAAKKIMARSKVDPTLISFGGNILYALGLTFVVIAALSQLGIETTSLAAAIAAAGLAIGLALQDSLANFASGVMLILFKPFKIGDLVNAGGAEGIVEDISIFTTQFKTLDNKLVVIPNGAITSGNITNITAKPIRRVDLIVGVSYGDDLKKVKSVLTKILDDNELVLKDPAYTVAVKELGDSSVNLVVRPWVKTEHYWDAHFQITETVKNTFDEEGISIPFPQQDIHVMDVSMMEKA